MSEDLVLLSRRACAAIPHSQNRVAPNDQTPSLLANVVRLIREEIYEKGVAMSRLQIMRGLALGMALMISACDDKKEPAKTPVPVPPPAPVKPQASAATTQPGTLASARIPAATTSPTTNPSEAAKRAGDVVAEARPAKSAEQSRQAQDLIGKAIAAINANNFDEARQSLDKAESMRADLPQMTLDSMKKVRTDLDRVEKLQNPAPPLPGESDNK
jgi:hypothetical protein